MTLRTFKNLIFSTIIACCFVIVFSMRTAESAPNYQINYQGKLTNASGVAVADGTYNMRFWLLTSPSIATTSAVWTESLTSGNKVQVTDGLFSVMLGSTSVLTSVDFNQTLYLGVEIGGSTTPSWDGEMSPRKILGSVPSAFEAKNAETLAGIATTSFLRSDQDDSASGLLTFTGGIISTASSTITNLTSIVATTTTLVINGDQFTDLTGTSLAITNGALGVATSTFFTTSSQLASWLSDETGTGNAVFSASPTLTGLVTMAYATATGISGTNLNFTNATATTLQSTTFGVGTDFITDLTGSGLSIVGGALTVSGGTGGSNWLFDGTRLTPSSTVGIGIFASSTIGDGTGAGGLTISGGATTTGNAYFGGNVGIGSTSPFAKLSIFSTEGGLTPLFSIASSTGGAGTSTAFVVDAYGRIGIGKNNPGYILDMQNASNPTAIITNTATQADGTFASIQVFADVSGYNNGYIKAINTGVTYNGHVDFGSSYAPIIIDSGSNGQGGIPATYVAIKAAAANAASAELMRINTTGVGIGTTSPGAKLDVAGTNNASIPLLKLSSVASFATTTRLIVTNAGNVGIGSTTPSRLLTVSGDGHFSNNLTAASSTITYASSTGVSGTNLNFTNATATTLQATTFGVGTDFITDLTGSGLSIVGGALTVSGGTGGSNWLFDGTRLTPSSTVGIGIFASSTIGDGTATGGLTINGGATTTGNAYFGSNVGIGTTEPSATLTLIGSGNTNLFAFGSSTGANFLSLDTRGVLTFGNSEDSNIYMNGGAITGDPSLAERNIALGYQAASYNGSSGDDNIALGYQALFGSSTVPMTGYGNFAGGYQALLENTTGYYNNAFGYLALSSNTIGWNNNAMGASSMIYNKSGSSNNALGNSALYYNDSGSYNNALGESSLGNNTTGSHNNALGNSALYNNNTGSSNIGLGFQAGFTNDTGNSNIFIGHNADVSVDGFSTSTAIGAGAIVGCSNCLVLGGTGINYANVGIGSSSPTRLLTVSGDAHILNKLSAASSTITYASSTGISGTNLNFTNATATTLQSTTFGVGTDFITDLTGSGLTVTSGALGVATSTFFTTSSQLASWLSDETGTGNAVFSASPTLTGLLAFSYASGTSLTLTGTGHFAFSSSTNASTTGLTAGNAYILNMLGIGTTSPIATLAIAGTGSTNPFTIASSSGSSMFTILPTGYVGVGTSSPSSLFAVSGTSTAQNFIAYATTSTTTIAGGLDVGGGALVYSLDSGETTISSLITGTQSFDYDAGVVQWTDLPVWAATASTTESYTASIGGNPMLTIYGLSTGASTTYNNMVGIGSTTPSRFFTVDGGDAFFQNNITAASSTITYASSTALTVSGNTWLTYASSTGVSGTNLNFTNATSSTLQATTFGVGTDFITDLTGSGLSIVSGALTVATSSFFTNSSQLASWLSDETGTGNAVFSASPTFTGTVVFSSLYATASSTIGGGTGSTGLTINGGATTTGNHYFGGLVGIGTTTPTAPLTMGTSSLSGGLVAGIKQYFGFTNAVENSVQFGNETYITSVPTATSTLVGGIIRIADTSALGNTLRAFEAQAHRGTNTKGENTGLSGFGRTFGVRGTTLGDAGDTYLPAGVFAETEGTTQGNALRAYSGTLTTEDLVSLFHESSVFSGTGLQMNFGNSGGSFAATSSAKFVDLQVAGTSKFTIAANGSTTIGDGTVNAGLIIPRGGICVDNDGSCISTTTGEIRSVTSATGNSDLAEMYFSSQALDTGEIVSLAGGLSIHRADGDTQQDIIGVVSTKPGLLLGFDDSSLIAGEHSYPVGLKGRVPIKLSTENGPIKKGDRITLSSIPGVGMKALESSRVVGIALEDFDGERAYSDGFLNQFGDDMVKEKLVPRSVETDVRADEGCYYGGGTALGEDVCEKKDPVHEVVVAKEEGPTREEILNELQSQPAYVTETTHDNRVEIGQALMFIELGWNQIDMESLVLRELVTPFGESQETLFDRIKTLALNFIDGVLTLTGIRADRVEVNEELCIEDVCVTADDLRALLKNKSSVSEESVSKEEESTKNNDEEIGGDTSNEGGEGSGEDVPVNFEDSVDAIPDSTEESPVDENENEGVVEETPDESIANEPSPEVEPEPEPEPEIPSEPTT